MRKVIISSIIVLCFILTVAMGWIPKPPPVEPPVPPSDDVAIIMLHGLFGTPSNMYPLRDYLVDNGFNESLIFVPSMVSNYTMCSDNHIVQVEDEIFRIQSELGINRVILIGYSRGGTAAMSFMRYGGDINNVEKVITIAGANNFNCEYVYGPVPEDQTPGDAVYTSIFVEPTDGLVRSSWAKLLDGANNIVVSGYNHFDIISSSEVHALVLSAINN